VPGAILELLTDVIAGRQFCANLYAAQAASDPPETTVSEQSIKSHSHFVEVLQQVYTVLRDTCNSQRVEKHTALVEPERPEVKAKDSLPNSFAHLDVEQPSDSPLGAEPEPHFKTTDAGEAHTVDLSHEIDDIAEKEFALWCLLEDFTTFASTFVLPRRHLQRAI